MSLAQVPHDPLRMYVMGERAVAGEPPPKTTSPRCARSCARRSQAGAAGFSTGRSDNHRTARGAATPASEVDAASSLASRGVRGLDHGVLQAVSDFDMMRGPERFDPEFDLLEQMARASGGRPLSISTMQRDTRRTSGARSSRASSAAVAAGPRHALPGRAREASACCSASKRRFIRSWASRRYKAIAHLPLAERVAAHAQPELRARMLAEKSDKIAGDGTPSAARGLLPREPRQGRDAASIRSASDPNYEPTLQTMRRADAGRAQQPVLERIYDALLEDDGKALLYFPIYNYTGMNLEIVREMLTHPRALVGLAMRRARRYRVRREHADVPAHALGARSRDGIPLERVVQMQARDTARFIGLVDRGTLEVGMRADLNVVELSKLSLAKRR